MFYQSMTAIVKNNMLILSREKVVFYEDVCDYLTIFMLHINSILYN